MVSLLEETAIRRTGHRKRHLGGLQEMGKIRSCTLKELCSWQANLWERESSVIVVGFATILILDLIQTIYYSSAHTTKTSKLVSR